jgi:uncharacterized protein
VVLDQRPLALDVVTDVDALVRAALEREKGKIIASAIVRLIVRGAVGAGTGVGVARATNNSGLGMLAAQVTQAAMVAADIPDTRSWATLPARIAIARVRVPAGRHSVRLSAQGVVPGRGARAQRGGRPRRLRGAQLDRAQSLLEQGARCAAPIREEMPCSVRPRLCCSAPVSSACL